MPTRPPRRCTRPGCGGIVTRGHGHCEKCQRSTGHITTVVAGPPCSGKSTYVAQRRGPADLIVDLDALHIALGAPASHDEDSTRLPFACAARDAVIARLGRAHDIPHAWVIACAPLRMQREVVAGAEVVVLDTTAEVCHQRADRERPALWHELIDKWFATYEP